MASVQDRIRDASARNSQLLASLHETQSAPSQLYQQINYLKDLETQIKASEKQVADLKRKTQSELKDHKKYSESTFRRFAHKATGQKGKFEEKSAKEEREYFDAIQAQKTAEDDLAYAKQLHAEADIARADYERTAQRHESLQRELDALYDGIFKGYTPGFPDEDEREQDVELKLSYCNEIEKNLEKEKQGVYLLRQMMAKLSEGRQYLDAAHSASQMDLFGGGTFSSMQKRNYLERAESSISQVRLLQQQVKNINRQYADIGPMNINIGSIWGDVLFDNIFTDMDMHDKIKQSEAQLDLAGKKLFAHMRDAEGKEKSLQNDLNRAGEAMRNARVELQKARERAFERVESGGTGGASGVSGNELVEEYQAPQEAPPAYHA